MDFLKIQLQVLGTGAKIQFQYKMFKAEKADRLVAEAATLHIPVDGKLKPVRPDPRLVAILEKEKWTETWLSNS